MQLKTENDIKLVIAGGGSRNKGDFYIPEKVKDILKEWKIILSLLGDYLRGN